MGVVVSAVRHNSPHHHVATVAHKDGQSKHSTVKHKKTTTVMTAHVDPPPEDDT